MRVANCVQGSCAVVIYAALVFEPGPRRRLRRRWTVFVFGGTGAATFFVCAIFSATAFGGRPGPPGRHFPRALRRRRRPFVALFLVETVPSNDWIAEPTSCCTMSRITVTRLRCLGIASSFCDAEIYERAANSKNDTRSDRCASDLGSAPERIRPKHPAVPVVEDAALVGDAEHDAIGAQVERANLLRRG